ncbi:MAG: IS110 family transposase [Gaiellaceae bacterium]
MELEEAQVSIVCGFDVHRDQITFDLVDRVSGEVRTGRVVPATRAGLRSWLGSLEPLRLSVALEATTGWRFVVEELERAGARAVLAEPAGTRALRGPKRRAKTDRADARHLRELLERDAVPESWIPPLHLQELRMLIRLRQSLADERHVWLQRVHAQLFHQGAPAPRRTVLGADGVAARAALSPACRELVDTAERMCEAISREIAGLDQQLSVWARRHHACRALQRLFGVGPITAVAFYAEIGDARRLSSSRKLVRLAGLDVTVSESADKRSPGRLSRQGAPILRWAAYEAALSACRRGSPDHADYQLLRERLGHGRATLTIARKLLRRAYHILVAVGDDLLEPVSPQP